MADPKTSALAAALASKKDDGDSGAPPPALPADPSPPAPSAPAAPTGNSAEEQSDLRLTLGLLKDENAALRASLKAFEDADRLRLAAASAAKAAKTLTGPRIAVAKFDVIGEGRRVVSAGMTLLPSEVHGLEEGLHYDSVQT